MTPARRSLLLIVGVLALIATSASVGASASATSGAGRAGRALRPALAPVAYLAGAKVGLAVPPTPVPAPSVPAIPDPAIPAVENTQGAPLVFDHPGSSLAADAVVDRVAIFGAPGDTRPSRTLTNPTVENVPLIFGVKEQTDGWVKVQFPQRPNESTGWVKASDVRVRSVPNHIVVEVAKRKLSAFSGTQLLLEAPVGVGTPRTPTPLGSFYVDISLKNPGGAYGRHILSVAGFSNVLKTFGKGVGQIAIHGTNNPGSVGRFSSNGCLRLSNDVVVRLAELAPTGTPVFIVP